MFAFGSIDVEGICHLNNKSHAVFLTWGEGKIGMMIKKKMKVDVMKRTF